MIGTVQCVVLDCPDSAALARFYQALLGGAINQRDRRWAVSADFSTRSPFLPAPWPSAAPAAGQSNAIH
jgi:hypothetical protein